jgi:stearoyl-CoA desaturase (delta-9 desaturase)
MSATAETPSDKSIDWMKSVPFFLIHAAAVAGVWTSGWSWKGFALAIGLYYLRMFGITAGYHRYFSHRAFRTSRPVQLLFALLAQTSAQKGVLWWAAHHRVHHKYSDQEGDVHSLLRDGFWWSHVGWILSKKYDATDHERIRDLEKFPELRWLDRWHLVPPVAFGLALYLLGGWHGFLWGFLVSTTILYHGTFTINSITHVLGKRRYATTDNSRNSWLLSIVTMGEGWHNNHHFYQRSTRQGFYWWEWDPTYYILRVMSALGLVWDLHDPPRAVRDARPSAAEIAAQA